MEITIETYKLLLQDSAILRQIEYAAGTQKSTDGFVRAVKEILSNAETARKTR